MLANFNVAPVRKGAAQAKAAVHRRMMLKPLGKSLAQGAAFAGDRAQLGGNLPVPVPGYGNVRVTKLRVIPLQLPELSTPDSCSRN